MFLDIENENKTNVRLHAKTFVYSIQTGVYYSTSYNPKCQIANIIKTQHFSVYHVTAD